MTATADITSGAPMVDDRLISFITGPSTMKLNGSERRRTVHVDVARRQSVELPDRHVVVDRAPDFIVGCAAEDGDACALSRGVGQHLPGLIRATELEDRHRDQQDERNRDGGLEQSGAAFVLGQPASQPAHVVHHFVAPAHAGTAPS